VKALVQGKKNHTMPPLLQVLKEDHRNLAILLDMLESEIRRLQQDKRADFEILEAILGYLQRYGDQCHHPKENLIYARLRKRDGAEAKGSSMIQNEHKTLAQNTDEILKDLRDILCGTTTPRPGLGVQLAEYLAAYRAHMAAEDTHFFPTAENTLSLQDWKDIESDAEALTDAEFARNTQERFLALRDYIHRLNRLNLAG